MRCRNCQLLGHTLKRCTRSKVCVNCNLPPHDPEPCTRLMCANCLDAHSSASKDCPKFLQNKEILAIKIRDKCSMSVARRTYSDLNKPHSSNTLSLSERIKKTLANNTHQTQNSSSTYPTPQSNTTASQTPPLTHMTNRSPMSSSPLPLDAVASHNPSISTDQPTLSSYKQKLLSQLTKTITLNNDPSLPTLNQPTTHINSSLSKTHSLNNPTNNSSNSLINSLNTNEHI